MGEHGDAKALDGFTGTVFELRVDSRSHESVSIPKSGRLAGALTDLHQNGNFMHMRTTLNIDDRLLTEAQRLSGLKAKTAVLHAGLEALIARESARRLAALGGREWRLKPIPRRRPTGRG